jgi:hypothetical protein
MPSDRRRGSTCRATRLLDARDQSIGTLFSSRAGGGRVVLGDIGRHGAGGDGARVSTTCSDMADAPNAIVNR